MKKFFLLVFILSTAYYHTNGQQLVENSSDGSVSLQRLYIQARMDLGNNWTRGGISSNIKWSLDSNKWVIPYQQYNDFTMMQCGNGGNINFYTSSNQNVRSQYAYTNQELRAYQRMVIHGTTGYVGIGTENPSDKLSIYSDSYDKIFSIERWGNSQDNKFDFRISSQPIGSAPLNNGSLSFVAEGRPADFSFITNESSPVPQFIFNKDGRMGIGLDASAANKLKTSVNSEYRLYISGGILATKVKVAFESEWPDYVFTPTYQLMPLSEVEKYIANNKHLPDVPSAEEVAKEGIDLAAMDAKLLQKIEELMLYTIEQQKMIEALKKEVEELKKK